jgi:hypothetical protein
MFPSKSHFNFSSFPKNWNMGMSNSGVCNVRKPALPSVSSPTILCVQFSIFFSYDAVGSRHRSMVYRRATCLKAGVRFSAGQFIFLFSIASTPVLGSTQTPLQRVPEALYPGMKRLGLEADHLYPVPMSPYVFLVWCLINEAQGQLYFLWFCCTVIFNRARILRE